MDTTDLSTSTAQPVDDDTDEVQVMQLHSDSPAAASFNPLTYTRPTDEPSEPSDSIADVFDYQFGQESAPQSETTTHPIEENSTYNTDPETLADPLALLAVNSLANQNSETSITSDETELPVIKIEHQSPSSTTQLGGELEQSPEELWGIPDADQGNAYNDACGVRTGCSPGFNARGEGANPNPEDFEVFSNDFMNWEPEQNVEQPQISTDPGNPVDLPVFDADFDFGKPGDPLIPGTPQLPEQYEEDCATSKYDLRPSRGVQMSSFIDNDETENYDPDEERRQERERRAKLRARRLQQSNDNDQFGDLHDRRQGTQENELDYIVLKFETAHHRQHVQDILEANPSQDDGDESEPAVRIRSLRQRAGNRNLAEIPDTDEDISKDLTGHPQARGCRQCLESGAHCRLLDDETAWPCPDCEKSQDQCELIIEPKFKQNCDRCKGRKLKCSFASSYNHAGPCENCQDANKACKAGPMIDQIPSRIRYVKLIDDHEQSEGHNHEEYHEHHEGDETNSSEEGVQWIPSEQRVINPPKLKKVWTCTQCRGARGSCSLSTDHTNDQCKTCEAQGLHCQKEYAVRDAPLKPAERAALKNVLVPVIPIVQRAARTLPKRKAPASSTRARAPATKRPRIEKTPSSPTSKLKPKGKDFYKPFRYRTKFCHPIEFHSKPDPDDFDNRCDFCDGSSFPFFGLGRKKPMVRWVKMEDGPDILHEVSGGHHEAGKETTKMCQSCTMARAYILDCRFHQIRALPSGKPTDQQVQDALDALGQSYVRSQDLWCAVCPAPATAECQANGTKLEGHGPGKGCGLMLCEQCRSELARKYGGQFPKMLNELKDRKTEERPLGLRADSVFLKRENGLLFKIMFPNDKRRK